MFYCRSEAENRNRKDKTLVEILDRLKVLEGKIDNLSGQEPVTSSDPGSVSSHPLVHSPEAIGASVSGMGANTGGTVLPPPFSDPLELPVDASFYKYASSVHEMFAWPAVQELLAGALPNSVAVMASSLDQTGVSALLSFQQSTALPTTGLPVDPGSSVLTTQLLSNTSVLPHIGNTLSWEMMQTLSTAFFETFNLLHPIVDRQHFLSTTLPTILTNGLDDGVEATLAYLIFALGEVAVAGPLSATTTGHSHGDLHSPGLFFFNEARRRMGFHLASITLSSVQILALTGIYYSTTFRHAEFWRSTASASLACQALVNASRPEELSRDLLRRVFWHCSLMETFLGLEVELPTTGLNKYESQVPVPDFSGGFSAEDHVANETSHFQEHFASQIVLRRLATDFHAVLSSVPSSTIATPADHPSTISCTLSMPETIRSLTMQLDHWRETLLPAHLHWREDEPESFPGLAPGQGPAVYGAPEPTMDAAEATSAPARGRVGSRAPMFTPTLAAAPPVSYPYAMDIQVALLRSRYYVTKHLIHRPYLYKALHHPDKMTQQDATGLATCLRACLRWPIAMAPACGRKRLVPRIFYWTQNLLGVLLVLWMSERVEVMQRVRRSGLCGERFEEEAGETVRAAVAWLRDLSAVDGKADEAWGVVKTIYGLGD